MVVGAGHGRTRDLTGVIDVVRDVQSAEQFRLGCRDVELCPATLGGRRSYVARALAVPATGDGQSDGACKECPSCRCFATDPRSERREHALSPLQQSRTVGDICLGRTGKSMHCDSNVGHLKSAGITR